MYIAKRKGMGTKGTSKNIKKQNNCKEEKLNDGKHYQINCEKSELNYNIGCNRSERNHGNNIKQKN